MGGCGFVSFESVDPGQVSADAIDVVGSTTDAEVGEGDVGIDVAPPVCTAENEGMPCDDFDACTPSSTCVAETCVAESSLGDGCLLADSLEDFQGTQGAGGWYYGEWIRTGSASVYSPTDFSSFIHEPSTVNRGTWHPMNYDPDPGSPNFTWCYIAQYWQHPEHLESGERRPIRRWQSPVSGPVRVVIRNFGPNPDADSNGVRLEIFVDGASMYERVAFRERITDEVTLFLQEGQRVDFVVDANGSDANDTTELEIEVHGV